jgi:ATP synthase protein I
VVVGFFCFGTLTTSAVAAVAPGASLVVALLTYTLQVVLLFVLLVAVTRSPAGTSWLDVRWLAGTVLVGTLCWTVALVVHALRSTPEVTAVGQVHR